MFFKLQSRDRLNRIMLRRLLRRRLKIKRRVKMVLIKIKNVLKEIFYQNVMKQNCKIHFKKIKKIKDLQDQKS